MLAPVLQNLTSDLCNCLRELAHKHSDSYSIRDVQTCAFEARAALDHYHTSCTVSQSGNDEELLRTTLALAQQTVMASAQQHNLPEVLSATWQLLAKMCRRLMGCMSERYGDRLDVHSLELAASAGNNMLQFLNMSCTFLGRISESACEQLHHLSEALERQAEARQAAASRAAGAGTPPPGGIPVISLSGSSNSKAAVKGSKAKHVAMVEEVTEAAVGAAATANSDEVVEASRLVRTMSLLLGQVERSQAVLSLLEAVSAWTELIDSMAGSVQDDSTPSLSGMLGPDELLHSLLSAVYRNRNLSFALEAAFGRDEAIAAVLELLASGSRAQGGGHPLDWARFRTAASLQSCLSDAPRALCQLLRIRAIATACGVIQLWTEPSRSKPLGVRACPFIR